MAALLFWGQRRTAMDWVILLFFVAWWKYVFVCTGLPVVFVFVWVSRCLFRVFYRFWAQSYIWVSSLFHVLYSSVAPVLPVSSQFHVKSLMASCVVGSRVPCFISYVHFFPVCFPPWLPHVCHLCLAVCPALLRLFKSTCSRCLVPDLLCVFVLCCASMYFLVVFLWVSFAL